ncbi:carboxy methyl transferase for protein phosphatase 2A [Irineochytrium annulatum]|nr:carboxy methyl transferase for protein phosphatase 2A [Irineochytrium annulatum]
MSNASADDAVRGTNDDATISRASAVSLGYLQDPYVKAFMKNARTPVRRPPIINRGTYIRARAIDTLMDKFWENADLMEDGDGDGGGEGGTVKVERRRCQIVTLGAGSDTRFFTWKARGRMPVKYFEVDFAEITSRKAMMIKKNKELTALLAAGGTELHTPSYCILSGDLRSFTTTIAPKLLTQGFSPSIPTLYLSECVLVYLPPESTTSILSWCSTATASSLFITYEQINPHDAFGRTMIDNLRMRNITLPGLDSCPSLAAHVERFKTSGFKGARAVSMKDAYDVHLSEEEKARVGKLEIFDEVEEWRMMGEHYCVSWGWNARTLDETGGSVGAGEQERERGRMEGIGL